MEPGASSFVKLAALRSPSGAMTGGVSACGKYASCTSEKKPPAGGPMAGGFFSDVHEAYFPQADTPPVIAPDGLRNAASFTNELAPGSIVALFGAKLAYAEQQASRFPLP